MEIFKTIKKFFTHYLEDTIQNIEIISSIRSENEINTVLKNLDAEINFTLNSTEKEIEKHYIDLGKTLYQNHISHTIIVNILEKLKDEILYAINHKNIIYDENKFFNKNSNNNSKHFKGLFGKNRK